MYNNPARIQDLVFDDGELLIRPMCVEAVYKKNLHDGLWDVEIHLSNGNVLVTTFDDDIVNDVIHRIVGFSKDCEDAV